MHSWIVWMPFSRQLFKQTGCFALGMEVAMGLVLEIVGDGRVGDCMGGRIPFENDVPKGGEE